MDFLSDITSLFGGGSGGGIGDIFGSLLGGGSSSGGGLLGDIFGSNGAVDSFQNGNDGQGIADIAQIAGDVLPLLAFL